MHLYYHLCLQWLLAVLATAAPNKPNQASQTKCTHGPNTRACWGDFDISTNYYDVGPDTGVVREYWFNVVNTTAAPDGVERIVLSVNGTVPGPTIYADWGDTIVVHVTNSLTNNGTGIHFHGVRQNYTAQMDGVPSLTQCPIAPGDSYTYTWRATEYGTSWWHSHFYVQAYDGVFGGIHINGPASANYDEDLGVLFLNDWSHITADQQEWLALWAGPPVENTGLINGTNVYGDVGTRFETNFTSGTRYRLRLISAAANTQFKFTIDNHTMEVIANDFVPIVPYTTDIVRMGSGQRYDVIVTADATPGNYWMRAIVQDDCSQNDNGDDIKGIVRYVEKSTGKSSNGKSTSGYSYVNGTADPTSTAWASASVDDCDDEAMANLVPYVAIAASDRPENETDFTLNLFSGPNGAHLWEMGDTTFVNEWDYPTLLQIYEQNNTWSSSQNPQRYPTKGTWAYWILQTVIGQPHPMHLHGHDFWILAQETGTFNASTANYTLVNAPRRDTVMVPGNGYVVIAFYVSNPGVWLMHCHIAWHTVEGLAVQIIEMESEIPQLIDPDVLESTCAGWDKYVQATNLSQGLDAGI